MPPSPGDSAFEASTKDFLRFFKGFYNHSTSTDPMQYIIAVIAASVVRFAFGVAIKDKLSKEDYLYVVRASQVHSSQIVLAQ
ncbi:hypothetical protein BDN71DRAFT_1513988 [Pleurotus eryngii]|uniref:Uncharacterized protein n=1 Tax=Pleurotus eryngii TaxID=5323 RepID=A0A9P5ZFQ4_PLEER|nr:hypothetical protein BDN71DRAFT_1513988 [Pleurotus eryngii]